MTMQYFTRWWNKSKNVSSLRQDSSLHIHLQYSEVIVIIGGGSIGMCTALNLAKDLQSTLSTRAKIIVVELFDKPFAATSSTCTGCLHFGFPELETQQLLPLGEYSFDEWEKYSANASFQKLTGYRASSSFGVSTGSGQGIEELPDWIRKEADWDIDENVLGGRNAMVNPAGIGEWLTAECLSLGVEIRTGLKCVGASLSSSNEIRAIDCLDRNDDSPVRIDCSKLLVACGPWTPVIFQNLFPSSPIQLQSSINAGDWLVCKNPCPTTFESSAFVSLAKIVNEKFEFAGRNDGTIWCCGQRNMTATLPAPGEFDLPEDAMIESLRGYAQQWLNLSCDCDDKHTEELVVVDTGRAFRPATKSGLPVISSVKPSDLSTANTAQNSASGVFVSWGHGSYGLTLGMGTGKLMGQLMCGKKLDIDISLFDISQNSGQLQEPGSSCDRLARL